MNAHKDDERPFLVDEKTPTPTLKTSLEPESNGSGSDSTSSEVQSSETISTTNGADQSQAQNENVEIALGGYLADVKNGAEQKASGNIKAAQYATEKVLKQLPRLWLLPAIILLLSFGSTCPGDGAFAIPIGYFYWVFATFKTAFATKKLFNDRVMNPWIAGGSSLLPAAFALIGAVLCSVLGLHSIYTEARLISAATLIGTVVSFCVQWTWVFKTTKELSRVERDAVTYDKKSVRTAFLYAAATNLALPACIFLVCSIDGLMFLLYPQAYYSLSLELAHVTEPVRALILLLGQFGGLWLFRKKIIQVARKEAATASKATTKNLKPPVSDDDYIVPYRPFEELERWFKQRTTQRSTKKLLYVLTLVLIFIGVGAPQWTLNLLISFAANSGAANAGGAAALANANMFIVNAVQTAIWVLMLLGIGIYNSKPTHIGMSKRGIRFLWRHIFFNKDGAYFDWKYMERISLVMPKGKTAPTDQNIVFESRGNGNMELRVGSIMEAEQRGRVLKAIEKFAPEVHRDATVLQALEPPADHSYTELWLQALSAPPKRERFKPMTEGSKLKEGRFEIKRQLGVGGQGTAYLAADNETGEDIVLKEFILPVYVDVSVRRQSLERFENEARILKQLDHNQIVKLKDFFVEDHRSYLVLEHIDGQSLKEIVEKEGPMPEERVRALGKQMCDILEYLHGLEPAVVHRDFTPDNLILRKDGTLKLVDFNVAQQTESTATGTVVGKHAYLPPEQFRGTPGTRSDIYAMGATLHFLLTGKEPEPISVSHPKRINPSVSDQMNVTVEVATALTEEARYNSAQEVKQALE